MPVRKFRSIEEMKRQSLWREPGDPMLYRVIRDLWELASRTGVHVFPHGVYKHRSIEDMQRLTERWNKANFLEHQRRAASTDGAPVGSATPAS